MLAPAGRSITGTSGADRLTGTAENDTLNGGKGADTLAGGLGADSLEGKGAADSFGYTDADQGGDTIADFAPGTQARTRIEQFAYNYSSLLNSLHLAFNGEPERLDAAIGLMYDLRVLAAAMMQTVADPRTGQTVGPSYEYVRVQGGMS